MGKQREFQLMITTMVAIVAVVGLVVHFSGATGAYTVTWARATQTPFQIGVNPGFYEHGYNVEGPACVSDPSFDVNRRCCNTNCQEWCTGKDPVVSGRTEPECLDACESGCELRKREIVSTA